MVSFSLNEYKLETLKQEIDFLSKKVNHFDVLRQRTKQMAITLWLAAVGFALAQDQQYILFISIFVPLPFWVQDSYYHTYQTGFDYRFWAIREFIRDGRYLVEGKNLVLLSEYFDEDKLGKFPIPDYYGNATIQIDVWKNNDSALRKFFKLKTVMFYFPLVLCSTFLAIFVGNAQ